MNISEARREAERELGFCISDDAANEILDICKRKLAIIKKGEDYLPILYRSELPLKIQGMRINEIYERTRLYV